jgi:hypothetical protein
VNKEVTELLSRAAHEFILKAGVVVMRLWRTAASACLLVLLIGCTDTNNSGEDPATLVPTQGPPGQPTEPPVEPTEPETTQAPQQKPSIEIASAPIGGNVETNGDKQCAEVNWLGRNPIPDGTSIKVGAPQLEPGGVFELDQSGCADNLRPCTDVVWQASSFKACHVGVHQIATGDEVQLIMSVSATCATEADCQSLAGDVPGSQISFSPGASGG